VRPARHAFCTSSYLGSMGGVKNNYLIINVIFGRLNSTAQRRPRLGFLWLQKVPTEPSARHVDAMWIPDKLCGLVAVADERVWGLGAVR
jgi:hypothetical protein